MIHCIYFPGSSASVQITVDPKQPKMLPNCRFMGADHSKFV